LLVCSGLFQGNEGNVFNHELQLTQSLNNTQLKIDACYE